ncbi:MAG TPA: thiamine pyrophosphate-binding protein [Solirubrobacterales bacterium]
MSETTLAPRPDGAPPADLRVAHAIASALRQNGVDRLFLMTGGDLLLWRALRDEGIKLCLARSEASSVAMADAYARLSGRPAVVYGQWGPGAANVAGALADAHWARSPVVAITSTVPTTVEYKFEYQELDQPPMFAAVTKWQSRVNRPDRAGELIAQGLRIAASDCPGPVHIDIPADTIREPVAGLGEWTLAPAPAAATATGAAVEDLIGLLVASERPAILAGNGVLLAGGERRLVELAEAAAIPVFTTLGGKGSIPENHPLSAGVVGRYASTSSNAIVREADFVIAIGTDLGGLATDTYTLPSPQADVFQIDISAERVGQTRPLAGSLLADAGEACAALAARLGGETGDHGAWLDSVQERRLDWRRSFAAVAAREADGHVRPEAVVTALREAMAAEDILVADTGFMGAWGGALFPVHAAGRTFLRAAGTLGWAFPAVLGAQLAAGSGRRAFALIGDGGFGYSVGDLETAVRLGIPAVTLVLNNASLAYEHVGFEHNHGGDIVHEVCDFVDVDHGAIASAYGAFGARVDSAAALREALRKAISGDRPAVIDIVVKRTRLAPVTSFDSRLERDI